MKEPQCPLCGSGKDYSWEDGAVDPPEPATSFCDRCGFSWVQSGQRSTEDSVAREDLAWIKEDWFKKLRIHLILGWRCLCRRKELNQFLREAKDDEAR